MPNVVCLGELLIDLCAAEMDAGLDGARTFTKAAGGAPANVAVGLARLGESAGFVGAVGDDPFGSFLHRCLETEGVDVRGLARIPDVRTTLAFIAARSDGEKDIYFWRNPGADMCLAAEHVDERYIAAAEALEYGSISRIDEGPRAATDKARRLAAESGSLLVCDPNWRPTLWPNAEAGRRRVLEGFDGAHVAKLSDEEWQFITGSENLAAGAKTLFDRGVELVIRSEGGRGASYATTGCVGHVPGFRVNCVEPTGAGDGFLACVIVELLKHWRAGVAPGGLAPADVQAILRRANAVGAIACTRVGAIPSLPTAERVNAFLAGQ